MGNISAVVERSIRWIGISPAVSMVIETSEKALHDIFLQPLSYVCLFIDGLDEYDGGPFGYYKSFKGDNLCHNKALCLQSALGGI
jgi:hypothetical protein